MPGSGDLSRIGWIHALNATVGTANGVTSTSVQTGPPGDLIGNLSAVITATSLPTAASGGGAVTTKQIPDGAVVAVIAAAGTIDTMEFFTVNNAGALAAGATAITVDSQTARSAHAGGDPVYLVAFAPYLALATTTPTSHALGTEYTATGYARQLVAQTPTTVADPPVAANSGIITFGPMTAGTGSTVTCGQIMDNLTGGTADNMYAFFTWGTSKTPGTNDSLQIAAAALSLAGS